MSGGGVLWTVDQRTQPMTWGVANKTCGQFAGPSNFTASHFDETGICYDPKLDCLYVSGTAYNHITPTICGVVGPNHDNYPVGANFFVADSGVDGNADCGMYKFDRTSGIWSLMPPNQGAWRSARGSSSFQYFDPVKREIITVTPTNQFRHTPVDTGTAVPSRIIDCSNFGTVNGVVPGVNGGAPVMNTSISPDQNYIAFDWIGRKGYFVYPTVYTDKVSGVAVKARVKCIAYDLDWNVALGVNSGGVIFSGTSAFNGHVYSVSEPFKYMADPPNFDVPNVGPGGTYLSASLVSWRGGLAGCCYWDSRNRVMIFPETRDDSTIAFSVQVFTPPRPGFPIGSWEIFNEYPKGADWVPTVAPVNDAPRGVFGQYNAAANALFLSGIFAASFSTYTPMNSWETSSSTTRTKHWQWRYRA